MEERNKQLHSIWGKWWVPIRKWFYPSWLLYETSYRFYDYAESVHPYVINQLEGIEVYIKEIGLQILAAISSIATFAICTVFLTVPACFLLYCFFTTKNVTGTTFEGKVKVYV